MDSSEGIYSGIKKAGIDFIVSVPCMNLSKLLEIIDKDPEITHVPVTREEEGIGICAGAYIGGRKVAILMQNSGLGNSINALKSLTELYGFPLVMIISHRGSDGEKIAGQIPMGQSTPLLLESLGYHYETPKSPEEAYSAVKDSWIRSVDCGKPVALLFEIGYW